MRTFSCLLLACVASAMLGATCADGRRELHVLNRIGYGPDEWSRDRIRSLGVQGYIEEQLHPQTIDDSSLEDQIATLWPLTRYDTTKLRTTYHEYNAPDSGRLPGDVRAQIAAVRMMRNAFSKKQLEQVLVDFWYNHFNVNAQIHTARWAFATFERDAIRPHVLGRFRDMLQAVAKHPAMLAYLDNNKNFIPGFKRGDTIFGGNENYGRELLELHTVGVDAGYTIQDVQNAARVFTGWTIDEYLPNNTYNYFESKFQYLDAGHDKGAKAVMGFYIPPGWGMSEGEALLDFLAGHPATARFLAYKLVQRFVSETPPPALVDEAALKYLLTGGDLREVMRTILLSNDFLGKTYRFVKVKRPQHFVSSLARAVGVTDREAFAKRSWIEVGLMGEDLYWAAPPTGYPESSEYWRGEASFMHRANVAIYGSYALYGFGPAISSPYSSDPNVLAVELNGRLLRGLASATTVDRVATLATQIPVYARAPEVAAALLAGPEFLVH